VWVFEIVTSGATVFVSEKEAVATTPVTAAVTLYVPPVAFAVNVGAVAFPLASVFTWSVVEPPVNVPLAPEDGAVNVTVAPLTGLLPLSFTVATRFDAKAVVTGALWGLPDVAAMLAGDPALLVSAKAAFVVTADAEAFTV